MPTASRPTPPIAGRRRLRLRLVLLLSVLLAGAAHARFEWRDVVQDVTIARDGSVVVVDERTLWTDEDFGEAFICIGHDSRQRVTLLEGSGAVSSGPPARAFQQPCADGRAGTEVVVRQDQRVRERRVRFVYELEGTVDVYRDVVQWYWNLIQREHPPIRGYRLTVTAPGPMAAPFDAYVHRYANLEEPRVALSEDRRVLTVAFDRIPTGDGVEIRYLMDPALFDARGTQDQFEALLRDEARIAGVQQGQRRFLALRGHVAWGLLPLAWTLWLVWGIWGAYQRTGREPRTDGMKYPFEPPADVPPASVVPLLHQHTNASAMGPAWFATIMDLARRGFARFEGEGRRLALVLDRSVSTTGLEAFERQVLEYLGRAAAVPSRRDRDPDRVDIAGLEAYGKTHAQPFLAKWTPIVVKWTEGFMGGPLTTVESRKAASFWAGRAALMLLPAIGLAFLTVDAARVLAIAGGVAALLAVAVAAAALPAWRPEVARARAGWIGFRRTLTDYTRMKDAPPDFFQLWDRYYVYAAALGVAERYLKTLQRAAPASGMDQRQMVRQATWMGVANARDLGAMSRSISSLSSALAKSGASASSGGSSSGGGGGGGGGGSSGGR
jgi:uncharacterized membrane protein